MSAMLAGLTLVVDTLPGYGERGLKPGRCCRRRGACRDTLPGYGERGLKLTIAAMAKGLRG